MRSDLQQDLRDIFRTLNKTVVLVTHDMGEAFALGDRVALMDRGRLLQVGTEEDFRDRPVDRFVERFLAQHLEAGGEPA